MLRPFKRNQKDFRYRYENNPIQSSRLPKYEDRPLTNQGTICTGTRLGSVATYTAYTTNHFRHAYCQHD